MTNTAFKALPLMLFLSLNAHAFERVECMDRPDGSVYTFKRVPNQQRSLDVRIYHGWQLHQHSLPGLPIGMGRSFLNTRYRTRSAQARANAIAGFSPLERLIFNMGVLFHHVFDDCDMAGGNINCHEADPVRIGKVWVSELEFIFETRPGRDDGADAIYVIGISGKSANSGLAFSSGRLYFRYGRRSECLYLSHDGW